jgi:FKBP-type peptidyl-prolyl cis-trans isomerase 2
MVNRHWFILISIILLILVLITGCGPALAKSGDTVKIHYTGTLADGTEFDTSAGSEPIEFVIGEGNVISGFEDAVIGMKAREKKTFTLTPDQAYGQRNEELVFVAGRDELPPDITPVPGMQLQASQGIITIIEVTETTVKLDANHPLAGKDLTFIIELVEIGKSQSQGESLTSTNLAAALSSGKPTLAEFGSTTCIPCKQMKPILEELATTYKDKVNIVIIEVYDNRDLTNQYKIMAMPTQVVFDNDGKEVTRHVGFWSKTDILAQFKQMGIE